MGKAEWKIVGISAATWAVMEILDNYMNVRKWLPRPKPATNGGTTAPSGS